MPEVSWTPSTKQVASYIRARTRVAGGGIIGDFTEATRPTKAEAEEIIAEAVQQVILEIGTATPCTEDLEAGSGTCAALYAAMLIEQSYYPDQTTSEGNSFKSLQSLYKPKMQALANRVQRECGTGSGGEDGAEGVAISRASFDGRRLIGPNGPCW